MSLEYAKASLARMSLDSCVKCTICESQCPVIRATDLFTGPKFVGPQAERFRAGKSVDYSLDYCSGCGICTTSCPQGVKIAEINAQARAVMKADHMPIRDRIIPETILEGMLLTPVAPIANVVLANKPIRTVIEKVVGVHRDAPMPKARMQTFHGWYKKHKRQREQKLGADYIAPRGPLVFFHGCAGGYFEVETSKATVEVLEYLGYEVLVPKQGCCGLAHQSNGLFGRAESQVKKLARQLADAGEGLTIIGSSGSCAGMLRHEAHEIMGVDDPVLNDVGSRVVELSEFLLELIDKGEFPVEDLHHWDITVPYHQPCQVKSQGIGMPAIRMMETIPGVKVVESGEPCCGIAGTYGLKKEKYEVAQRVGKPLFDMVKSTNPRLAACETDTCRWQIAKGTGAKVVHPVQIMHHALGLGNVFAK
ncbi:anaerobic glycerol-3-phosphate dehydrogenase subunit C [Arcanobacterium phocae]|uniref:anaerobic glycerol-3-phosphate dehydrogenase subunit C n=1 Tax=Arcanobacterium phocae TaxID=131112 RepID=UPI001C0F2F19|nr:anaerobic glycerol-3-phosphate dehydrogenase subunit C [Arcanobacterium phocae]